MENPSLIAALVQAGPGGHEDEITVSFARWGHGEPFDRTEGPIPRSVEVEFVREVPASWKIENRGSRLEVHPSGRFAGGFDTLDVNAVTGALSRMGYEVEQR